MNKKIKTRSLKKELKHQFLAGNYERTIKNLQQYPPRQVVNPLISFLCSNNEKLKSSAVAALGEIISGLAQTDIESARMIMRRLMWHLNDESGGIGWGVPEAMGEIMAKNETLANEFLKILISYIEPGFNYLENDTLRKGARWGISRVIKSHPHLEENFPSIDI